MVKLFTKRCPIYKWAKLGLVVTEDPDGYVQRYCAMYKCCNDGRTILDHPTITAVVKPNATRGDVGHEAVHVAMQVLHKSGVRFNPIHTAKGSSRNDEALAYLVDDIIDWMHSRLDKLHQCHST